MAEKDEDATGSQIPEDEQLRHGEQIQKPVLPSDYVVVADASQIERSRRAKPSHGPIKPDDLPRDSYVVVPKPERAPEKTKAPVKPAHLPTDSYVVVADNGLPATAPLGEPAHSTQTEVLASGVSRPQVVYVTAPVPPKPQGNRLFGVVVAIVVTALFGVVFAIATLIIYRARTGIATMTMLANVDFWVPVFVFGIAFLLAVLIVNRAGWWAHIISSLLIGIVVLFVAPTIIGALDVYVYDVAVTVPQLITSPLALFAALIARELALWGGVVQSSRGRRVRERNVRARAEFDREHSSRAQPADAHG